MASDIQSDRAYAEIRRRIFVSDVRPGERLKEQEWAKKLAVGRPGVREALTRLHGDGLVSRGPKGGFFAATMTPADVVEIRVVREIFESAAIRLAGKRISGPELAELEATCDDFTYMRKKGYHTGAAEADRRFHELLIKASGNSRLARAYTHCHIPLFNLRVGQLQGQIDDLEETEREHRAIVAALKRRDTDGAVASLQAHLARGEIEVLSPIPAKARGTESTPARRKAKGKK